MSVKLADLLDLEAGKDTFGPLGWRFTKLPETNIFAPNK